MVHLIVVMLAGTFLAAQQAPPLVTQTELPPPGSSAVRQPAVPATPAAAAAPATVAPAPAPQKENKGMGAKETAPPPKTEPPKPPTTPAGAAGKRVAAFWIILPGKR